MIKRICYSRAHGFCYVRVPKAANSTITKTLAEHMDLADRLGADPRGQKAKKALRGLPSPANYAAAYRFTFVREPRSRVLSAWADKGHQPAWIARYRMGARDAPAQPAPFAQWLELLRDGLLLRNPHWAPQATILPAQGRDFDFIGRVETLDTDLPRVMEQIFGLSRHHQPRSPADPCRPAPRRTGGRARAAPDLQVVRRGLRPLLQRSQKCERQARQASCGTSHGDGGRGEDVVHCRRAGHQAQGIVAQVVGGHFVADLRLADLAAVQAFAQQREEQGLLARIGMALVAPRQTDAVAGQEVADQRYPVGEVDGQPGLPAGCGAWCCAASASPGSGDRNRSSRVRGNRSSRPARGPGEIQSS